MLLIDAAEGVREQTRRHAFLLHLLGLRQVIVAVNKMDRVDYDRAVFAKIQADVTAYLDGFGLHPTFVIPLSARDGGFVTARAEGAEWYQGPTILEGLDRLTAPPASATCRCASRCRRCTSLMSAGSSLAASRAAIGGG